MTDERPEDGTDVPIEGDSNLDEATDATGQPGGDDESAADAIKDDGDIEIVDFQATDLAGVVIPDVDDVEVVEEEEEELDLGDLSAAEEAVDLGDSDRVAELEDQLRDRAAQVEGLEQSVARATADFDNFRKRTQRERTEERAQAAAGLVKKVLPVLDSFGRALEQARSTPEGESALQGFVEGVELIHGQLFDILKDAGLQQVDASGEFDPNLHEALMQEASSEAPHLSILQVFETGYLFHGRLLRPARVKVASNPGQAGGAAGESPEDGGEAVDEAGADDGSADESADAPEERNEVSDGAEATPADESAI